MSPSYLLKSPCVLTTAAPVNPWSMFMANTGLWCQHWGVVWCLALPSPSPSPPGPLSSQGHASNTLSFHRPAPCTSMLSSVDSGLARLRVDWSMGDCSPLRSGKWCFMMTPVPGGTHLQLLGKSWLGQCWSLCWPQPEWLLGARGH